MQEEKNKQCSRLREGLCQGKTGKKKGRSGRLHKEIILAPLSFRTLPQAAEKACQFPALGLWLIMIRHSGYARTEKGLYQLQPIKNLNHHQIYGNHMLKSAATLAQFGAIKLQTALFWKGKCFQWGCSSGHSSKLSGAETSGVELCLPSSCCSHSLSPSTSQNPPLYPISLPPPALPQDAFQRCCSAHNREALMYLV